MSLINYMDESAPLREYALCKLFSGNQIHDAHEIILPDQVSANCYNSMFDGCSSLTSAPALPATSLVDHCYSYMFNGCTSLTTAPALPATSLADYCYHNMFNDCRSLTTAPELPATNIYRGCYSYMF